MFLLLLHVVGLLTPTSPVHLYVLGIILITIPAAAAWLDEEVERGTIVYLRNAPPLPPLLSRLLIDSTTSLLLYGLHLASLALLHDWALGAPVALAGLLAVLGLVPLGLLLGGISAIAGGRSLLQPILAAPLTIPAIQALIVAETDPNAPWILAGLLLLGYGAAILLFPHLLEASEP